MSASQHIFLAITVVSTLLAARSRGLNVTSDTTKNKIIVLDPKKVPLKEIGTLPKVVKEASGLAITNGNYLWTHNDDGIPVLYCLDATGHMVRAIHLNIRNRGWEDLAQDDDGNMYIGGFGNNKNDKRDLKIYKIHQLEKFEDKVIQPQMIEFTYADQKAFPPPDDQKNFDVDAFFALDGSLFLFSKNRTKPFTGYSKVYQLSQEPGKQTAQVVDSIFLGNGHMMNHWITGADISPDKKTIALLFHDHVWLIRGFQNNMFSSGKIYEIPFNHYSHKAGICFQTNENIFIVDELEFDLIGGKLYSLDLKPVLDELKP